MTKLIQMAASLFSLQAVGSYVQYAYIAAVLSQVLTAYVTFSYMLDNLITTAPAGFATAYYLSGLGYMAKMFFTAVTSGISVRLSRGPLIALLKAFGVQK